MTVCARLRCRSNGERPAWVGRGSELPTLNTICAIPGCRVLAFTRRFTHDSCGFVDVLRGACVGSSACLFSHDDILQDDGRGDEFEPGVVSSASGSVIYRILVFRRDSLTRQLTLVLSACASDLSLWASSGVR